MRFVDAQSYLTGTINETASRHNPQRLDRMRALLAHLGDPQDRYPTIHVGGTSGKGSTCSMLAVALEAAGLRAGLHTKPHLSSITERARVGGVAIPNERFGELLSEMLPAIERTTSDHGRPSYYETILALAFHYFAEEAVDIAVIEVGIGGLLDGTNVITPLVALITNVGLDHTDVLGDTVEAIALDKAGIAKRGVPLISGAAGSARAVIEARARAAGAPFVAVGDVARVEPRPGETYGQSFGVTTAAGTYDCSLPVLGAFQRENAAAAIVALEHLPPELRPDRDAVERGLARLVVPGRMEFFPGYPSVVFDIAHNPDKAAGLAAALRETFPGRRFAFVVSVIETKDALGILRPLFALPANFTFTSFEAAGRVPMRPTRLQLMAEGAGLLARSISDPIEALSVARRSGDSDAIVVVVTGSTFLVGKLRDWWLTHVAERSRT